MYFTPEQVISQLKSNPHCVFYNSEISSEAVSQGLEGNNNIQFLKIWSVFKNPKLILTPIYSSTSLQILQMGIFLFLLFKKDRNGFDKNACTEIANLMKNNKSIIELVLGFFLDFKL